MAKKDVVVTVDELAYNVGESLVKFIAAVKLALADGWQPGIDIPLIITAAIADLSPIIGQIGQLPEDFSADKLGFLKGINVSIVDLVDVLLKK